jgi:hypothetical protein
VPGGTEIVGELSFAAAACLRWLFVVATVVVGAVSVLALTDGANPASILGVPVTLLLGLGAWDLRRTQARTREVDALQLSRELQEFFHGAAVGER